MQIVHEAPHKDLAFMARAPLRLIVSDGQDVELREWCVAGVRAPDGMEIFPKRGILQIPFQGVDLRFPVKFTDETSDRFHAFEDLTVRQRETLALFHSNLLSGKMSSTDEMITALDTPVDLVPMSETEDEKAAATARAPSRLWRVVKALATYSAAALIIFGLLGQTLATRLLTIPTVQARVVAPLVDHRATAPAYVDRILVAEGDMVNAGDTLIRMSDPRRDGRLDDRRRDVREKKDALTEARNVLRKHLSRFDAVQRDLEKRLDDAIAANDAEPTPRTDAWVQAAMAALVAHEEGRSLVEGDYHDIRRDLKLMRDAADEDLRQAKRTVGIAKADARMLDVKATVDGTVNLITALEDVHVARGTALVSVEEHAPRVIRAWVDETHLTGVMPGQVARLRLPGGEGGTVAATGRVSDVVAGIDESAARRGFGLIVTIAVEGDPALTPGLPVAMRLWRGWVPDWARF
ncbi:HlyD family secretion protein [Pseudaestuariivita atlantica]|uniref:RND efflux pump membrane fusion protein barrel-sandwich domain-containing protein n=1 Tax=Pseudaestuariivita atlantica TaxID=1317121 RepID=A0A0L1JN02_9RHOB|nr:HlyD family efflux transporter periplasmic adaptor subunit [Pseudaestuariivita atlantica]KNG93087.1 hypothetical protein ATO11_14335 [Pseudaestuariivita atlantica]